MPPDYCVNDLSRKKEMSPEKHCCAFWVTSRAQIAFCHGEIWSKIKLHSQLALLQSENQLMSASFCRGSVLLCMYYVKIGIQIWCDWLNVEVVGQEKVFIYLLYLNLYTTFLNRLKAVYIGRLNITTFSNGIFPWDNLIEPLFLQVFPFIVVFILTANSCTFQLQPSVSQASQILCGLGLFFVLARWFLHPSLSRHASSFLVSHPSNQSCLAF